MEIKMNIEGFIEPYFQPVFSAGTREVYAHEALCRFKGRDTLPSRLFRQWEKSGLVCAVDLAMIRCVRKSMQTSKGSRISTACINISSRTVQEDPVNFLHEARSAKDDGKKVIIEITETYPIIDHGKVINFARNCRESGIVIALDDCSLDSQFMDPLFLRMLRPEIIKVDGEFFNTCFERDVISPLSEIVASAKNYRAKTVAEQIDCEEKIKFALRAGIKYAQGNYLGIPEPI